MLSLKRARQASNPPVKSWMLCIRRVQNRTAGSSPLWIRYGPGACVTYARDELTRLHTFVFTFLPITALGLGACGGLSPSAPSNAEPAGTAASTPAPPAGQGGQIVQALIPSCPGSGTPLFDTLPIALNDFMAFRPLGFLSPPIHMFPAKHSAFSMTLPGATAIPRPVRAPGRVWVKEIWEASFSTGGRNYQVYVYPCNEVRVYFGHIRTLSDELMADMQKYPATCNSFVESDATLTTCRHENMSLMLELGEEMGTGPDTAGVDFGVVDFRRSPAAFIRLDHYDHFYPLWASPFDYFTSDVRSTLASKTGHFFGTRMRTSEPIGGTHMQDVAGTAQGNWFFPGKYHSNSTDLSSSLGLASDYVDPAQPLMAVGDSIRA